MLEMVLFFLDKVDLLEFGVLLTYETNEGNQLDWIGISWGFVLLPKNVRCFSTIECLLSTAKVRSF